MQYLSLISLKLCLMPFLSSIVMYLCGFVLAMPLRAELLQIESRGGLAGAYVFTHEELDRVDAYLLIKSGGFDEDGPEGLGHYLEHLVWLNTIGADRSESTARDDGAWINGGMTGYSMEGTPDGLDSYLETLSKAFEPPALEDAFMLEERDIVLREYDYRILEKPLHPVHRDVEIRLFGKEGRGRSVLGTQESIAALTPEAAIALHARTHVPANAVLFILGNTDLATAEPLIRKHFGSLPAGNPPPKRVPSPFQQKREIEKTSVQGIASDQLIYAKRIRREPTIPEDRLQVRLDLLYAILDSTLEGSLAKPLRFDDFIARHFSLDLYAIEHGDVALYFDAAPDEGISLSVLMEAFEDTLQAIADQGIPKETFDRIKNKRLSALKQSASKRERARRLIIDQIEFHANPIDPETYIERYAQTTLDDVNVLVRALAGEGQVAATLVSPSPSD